ncbi:MAG: hypothetical protein ACFFE4_00410 [Candidatus Thorarchaeota archaeon]
MKTKINENSKMKYIKDKLFLLSFEEDIVIRKGQVLLCNKDNKKIGNTELYNVLMKL